MSDGMNERWGDMSSSEEESKRSESIEDSVTEDEDVSVVEEEIEDMEINLDNIMEIEEMFTPDKKELFSVLPSNATAEMRKFILEDGRTGYSLDVRSVLTDLQVANMAMCSLPIEVRDFRGENKNFETKIKTFITCTEYFKGENPRIMFSKVLDMASKRLAATNIISSKKMCRQVDSVFGNLEDGFHILRVNFIPTMKEVGYFHKHKVLLMIPSSKVVTMEEMPTNFKVHRMAQNMDTLVDTSVMQGSMQTREWDLCDIPNIARLNHISFMDKTMSSMTVMDSLLMNTSTMIEAMRKVKGKRVEVSQDERSKFSESIKSGKSFEMTISNVAKYLMVRSNMMERMVAHTLRVGTRNAEDELLPFSGESFIGTMEPWLAELDLATPDIIVSKRTSFDWETTKNILNALLDSEIEDEVIYFMEIKVTDKGSDLSSREAYAKYTSLCSKINAIAEREGRVERAKIKVLKFNLNAPVEEMERFTTSGLIHSSMATEYRDMSNHWMNNLSMNSSYQNCKTRFERSMSSGLDIKILDMFFGKYMLRDPNFMFMDARDGADIINASESEVISEITSMSMIDGAADMVQEDYTKSAMEMIANQNSKDWSEVQSRIYQKEPISNIVDLHEVDLANRVVEVDGYEGIRSDKIFKFPQMRNVQLSVNVEDIVSALSARLPVSRKNSHCKWIGRDTLAIPLTVMERADLVKPYLVNKKMNNQERRAMRRGANFSRDRALETEEILRAMICNNMNDMEVKKAVSEILESIEMNEINRFAIQRFCSNEVISTAFYVQLLMQDIAQLEGKRIKMKDASGKSIPAKSNCIFRNMGKFVLEIMAGPVLKQGSGVRFRVWARKLEINNLSATGFHSYKDVLNTNLCCTNYLMLYPIDLVTHLTAFEGAMMLCVGFMEKSMEVNPHIAPNNEEFISLGMRILQFMEHRNNTSATSQLSRYLLMGGTAFHADRPGCIREIGSDPLRSTFQNFTVMMQLDWCKKIDRIRGNLVQQMLEIQSTPGMESSRIKAPSFYARTNLDITMLLDEIYFCNLLDPNYGTRKHMTEATVKKMAKFEKKWREMVRNPMDVEAMKGKMDSKVWMKKAYKREDTYFMFDRIVVMAATKIIMRKVSMDQLAIDYLERMFENITSVMTLKSSVEEVGRRTVYDSGMEREKRSTAFETQLKFVKEFRCRYVIDACNLFAKFDYYLAEFPKPQIGGPREILIQDSYTRCKARLMENFFNAINKQFPDEMTSNASTKFIMQANMDNILDLDFSRMSSKEMVVSLANNKDHSKWAPGSNVLQYCYMVRGMDLPEKMEMYLIVALMSFGHARVGMPKELMDTRADLGLPTIRLWKEKDMTWMYEEFTANLDSIVIKSGWPQGMLQFCSSTYHVIEKSFMKAIWDTVAKTWDINWATYDMVTSDDTTDYCRIGADSLAKTLAFMETVITTGYMVGTSFNMHENKKKSNLQLYIKEFNSIFQVGRRVVTPIIKFLTKSVSVPDCTFPEEAAKELISQEQMLLENGASLMTLQACRTCHRRMLRTLYNQENYKQELMLELSCNENDLPIELGFLPKDYVMESIIYGADIYMYTCNSDSVNSFRQKLFTDVRENMSFFSVNKSSYTSNMLFKQKLQLPLKMDTKMQNMRERVGITDSFMNEVTQRRFDILIEAEDSRELVSSCYLKLAAMNVRYGMNTGFLYRAHSMVRANQISSELNDLKKGLVGVKTIMDFVKVVKKKNLPEIDAVNEHPMKGIYKSIISIKKDFDQKKESGVISAERSDAVKKFRKINFVNSDIYPYISKKDAYRIYRTPVSVRRSRDKYKAMTVQKYFKMTDDFHESSLVQFLNQKSSLTAMNLNTIFDNIISLMSKADMLIPSEIINTTNGFENYLNLIRHRTSTGYTYTESKPALLEVANLATVVDINEVTGFVGTVAQNATDAIQLYKVATTDKQRRIFQLSVKEASLAEKYVCFMNRFCREDEPSTQSLLKKQSKIVFYCSSEIRCMSDISEFRNLKMWIMRSATLVKFSNSTMYEFLMLGTSIETNSEVSKVNTWDQSQISEIVASERTRESHKNPSTKISEFFCTQVVKIENRQMAVLNKSLITSNDRMTALTLNLNNAYKNWTIESSVILNGPLFEVESTATVKLTSCRLTDHYPMRDRLDLSSIQDLAIRSKMEMLTMREWDFEHLEMDQMDIVLNQFNSQEEITAFDGLFEEEDMPDWLAGMIMQTDDIDAYSGMAEMMTAMVAEEMETPVELAVSADTIEERVRENLEDVGEVEEVNDMDLMLDEPIVAALMRVANRTDEGLESLTMEELVMMNMEDANRISKRAMYSRINDFMVRKMNIQVRMISIRLNNRLAALRRRGRQINYSHVAYDLLMALKKEMISLYGETPKCGKLFVMIAKPFVVSVVRSQAAIKIEKNEGDKYITDLF